MDMKILIDGQPFDGTAEIKLTSSKQFPNYPGPFTSEETGKPNFDFHIPAPNGMYTKFELTLSYIPRRIIDTSTRCIFWFVMAEKNRPLNRDMIGYLITANDRLILRGGMGIGHGGKSKCTRRFTHREGQLHNVKFVYDHTLRQIFCSVIADSEIVTLDNLILSSETRVVVDNNRTLFLSLGFPRGLKNPNEVPSYGWTYHDVNLTYEKSSTIPQSVVYEPFTSEDK